MNDFLSGLSLSILCVAVAVSDIVLQTSFKVFLINTILEIFWYTCPCFLKQTAHGLVMNKLRNTILTLTRDLFSLFSCQRRVVLWLRLQTLYENRLCQYYAHIPLAVTRCKLRGFVFIQLARLLSHHLSKQFLLSKEVVSFSLISPRVHTVVLFTNCNF